jgi:hypothetical protein
MFSCNSTLLHVYRVAYDLRMARVVSSFSTIDHAIVFVECALAAVGTDNNMHTRYSTLKTL